MKISRSFDFSFQSQSFLTWKENKVDSIQWKHQGIIFQLFVLTHSIYFQLNSPKNYHISKENSSLKLKHILQIYRLFWILSTINLIAAVAINDARSHCSKTKIVKHLERNFPFQLLSSGAFVLFAVTNVLSFNTVTSVTSILFESS